MYYRSQWRILMKATSLSTAIMKRVLEWRNDCITCDVGFSYLCWYPSGYSEAYRRKCDAATLYQLAAYCS